MTHQYDYSSPIMDSIPQQAFCKTCDCTHEYPASAIGEWPPENVLRRGLRRDGDRYVRLTPPEDDGSTQFEMVP